MKTSSVWGCCVAVGLLVATLGDASAGDQHDTKALSGAARAAVDIGDLYVFRSPANANNTVLIMTVSQFVGNTTKPLFKAQPVRYEFRIDTDADGSTDLVYAATFKAPDRNGVQEVTLTKSRGFDAVATLVTGTTNTNLPIAGGGMFRAGVTDDPFFFDQFAFDSKFVTGVGGFPRPMGAATNYYGPNANVLAIVLETPSAAFNSLGGVIGVWARTAVRSQQSDRCGRPLTNLMLIPPVPRNDPQFGDKRSRFNRSLPVNDRADYLGLVSAVLQNPAGLYHRSGPDAAALSNLLLPDQLMFQVGNPNGFGTFIGPGASFLGNGRRLSDDVVDVLFNILTNGAIVTDNVRDDNGLRITDGSVDPVSGQTRAIAFPYIGAANPSPGGPNP